MRPTTTSLPVPDMSFILFSAEEFDSRQKVYIQVGDLTEFFKADGHAWVSCMTENNTHLCLQKFKLSKLKLESTSE